MRERASSRPPTRQEVEMFLFFDSQDRLVLAVAPRRSDRTRARPDRPCRDTACPPRLIFFWGTSELPTNRIYSISFIKCIIEIEQLDTFLYIILDNNIFCLKIFFFPTQLRLNNREFNIDQNNRDHDCFHNRAAPRGRSSQLSVVATNPNPTLKANTAV